MIVLLQMDYHLIDSNMQQQDTEQAQGCQEYQAIRNKQIKSIRKQDRSQFLWKRRIALQKYHGDSEKKDRSQQLQGDAQYVSAYVFLDDHFRIQIQQYLKKPVQLGMLLNFMQYLKSNQIYIKLTGIIGIRRLLGLQNPPIQQVIQSDILDIIFQLALQKEQEQLQLQALWALTQLSYGNEKQSKVLMKRGVVDLFYLMLYSQHPKIIEIALLGLGNMACESFKDIIIDQGYLPKIIQIIMLHYRLYYSEGSAQKYENNNHSMIKNAMIKCINKQQHPETAFRPNKIVQYGCWTLANLCRGDPKPAYQKIKTTISPMLFIMQKDCFEDQSIYAECLWVLSYYCSAHNNNIDQIISSKIVDRLICKMSGAAQSKITINALKLIDSLVSADQTIIQYLLSIKLLPLLLQYLDSKRVTIRKQTCFILSNLAASSDHHIKALCNHKGLISKLIQMFTCDQSSIKYEISFVFGSMIASATNLNLEKMYRDAGIIDCYIQLIKGLEVRSVVAGLKNLFAILKKSQERQIVEDRNLMVYELQKSGGVQILHNLQHHKSNKVYGWASKIIHRFFVTEEDSGLPGII